jgi:chromosome segregation ATPase
VRRFDPSGADDVPKPPKRFQLQELDGGLSERVSALLRERRELGPLERPSRAELVGRVDLHESALRPLEATLQQQEAQLAGLVGRPSELGTLENQRTVEKRFLSRRIADRAALIDRVAADYQAATERCRVLREEHMKMERQYGIRSFAAHQSALDELSERTEQEALSNVQLRKRLGQMRKMEKRNKTEFPGMEENEREQEETTNRRNELRERLTKLRDEKTEMFAKRETLDQQLNECFAEQATVNETIEKLRSGIEENKRAIVEKRKTIVQIIEAYFRRVDAYMQQYERVVEINKRIEQVLREENPQPEKVPKAKGRKVSRVLF